MISKQLVIINKLGLHARAAAKLATLTGKFNCNITVEVNNKSVDGKSVMALMLLAAAQGSEIIVECDGTDETLALEKISTLINSYFGEEE